jgi:cathepsin A (carboxypeptidase C)
MLLTKKFAGLLGVFGSVLIVQAFNAPQHVFTSNVDTQGFRILQNDVIDGYSVRIKQPESCEEGVQVNLFDNPSYIRD